MEEIFEIRSCIEILANDIKIYTTDQRMCYSALGVETNQGREFHSLALEW